MNKWFIETPDGRTLRVARRGGTWIASCGEDKAESDLLDVALIEAIRGDPSVTAHALQFEYGPWIREQADQIERALGGQP